jgi:hypothetical protein
MKSESASLLPAPVRFGTRTVALRLGLAWMMHRRSLPDLLRALTPSRPPPSPAPLASVEQALSAAEDLVARLPLVPDGCLYRALARYSVLRSAGHPARFVMGILPKTGELSGHAWVELNGEPYGEDVDPALVVTYSYPSPIESTSRSSGS